MILEAGLAATSLSWAHVQPLIGEFTTAISYDRAGLGWSTEWSSSRTVYEIVDDLARLLELADVRSPCILVGHSFGGLIIRAFAHAYPHRVGGLVFVDPVSLRTWANCSETDRRRIALGAKLSRRGAWLARAGIVRLALAAASWRNKQLTRTITKASAGKAAPLLGRLVGEVQKLPREVIPIVREHWCTPKPFAAMAAYLESLPGCADEASQMPIRDSLPFTVLSAATATPSEIDERSNWAASSALGRHIQVENTGHWMHLDRPDVVVAAVRELIERCL